MTTGPRPVVVLGGTGFVGRQVASAFARAGCDVLTVARRPPSRPAGHRFVPLDLAATGATTLAALLDTERPATLVDATGSSWGLSDDEMAIRCTAPPRRLLEALALARCRPHLVHLGSVLEYGPTAPGRPPSGVDGPPPQTAYGRAKLAATRAVLAATRAGGVDGVVLRLTNAVGPGMPESSLLGRVAASLLPAAAAGTTAVVRLPPLVAHRDFVDVRDAADAVVAAARVGLTGRVVDVGRGEAVPVRSLVRLLVEVSGVPATVTEDVGATTGWRARTSWLRVDPGPAAALLGWRPRRDLADGVRDFWRDARERFAPAADVRSRARATT